MYSTSLVISELVIRGGTALEYTLTLPQSWLRRYGGQKDLNRRRDHCGRRLGVSNESAGRSAAQSNRGPHPATSHLSTGIYHMAPKVLVVCLGNICRSPMGEAVLMHVAKQRNVDITVDSAGTAGYHVGEEPDER
jgi:Low molecular weight phosphotyrosine protein phosphatase